MLRSVGVFIFFFSDFFFVTNSKRQWQYLVDYSLIPLLESHKNLSIIKKHTLQWFSSHSRDWNRVPLNPQIPFPSPCLPAQSAIQVDSFQFQIIILSDENAWNFYSFNFHHTTSVFYEWSSFVNTIMWMVVYISAWIGHFSPLFIVRFPLLSFSLLLLLALAATSFSLSLPHNSYFSTSSKANACYCIIFGERFHPAKISCSFVFFPHEIRFMASDFD